MIMTIALACMTILAICVAFSKMNLTLKLVSISVMIFSAGLTYLIVDYYKGLPLNEFPTGKMVIYGYNAREGEEIIYLWACPVDNDPREPRTYKFTYERPLNESLQEGKDKFKGKPYIAELKEQGKGKEGKKGAEGKGEGRSKEGSNKGKGDSLSEKSKRSIEGIKLPDAGMPDKNK